MNFCSIKAAFAATVFLTALQSRSPAYGGNWYVTPGGSASNTGQSWASAWSLSGINWSSVAAGDTVWLAGGTYDSTQALAPTKGGSASAPIHVMRVIPTDAVAGGAGWQTQYATSQVVIAPSALEPLYFSVSLSYMVFDGRYDSGIRLQLANLSGGSGSYPAAIDLGNGGNGGLGNYTVQSSITFTNLELLGPYYVAGSGGYNSYANGVFLNGSSHITFTHNRIHGFLEMEAEGGVSYITFDHNLIYDFVEIYVNGVSSAGHANILESDQGGNSNITFSNNQFSNWYNEGFWLNLGGSPSGPFYIYGNVFDESKCAFQTPFILSMYSGVRPLSIVFFYNNTVVDTWAVYYGGGVFDPSSQFRNNIYWKSGGVPTLPLSADDASDTVLGETTEYVLPPNPFVNAAAGNYQLAANTPPGQNLGPPYNVDMLGNIRATWTRGAYEFQSGTQVVTPVPLNAKYAALSGSVRAVILTWSDPAGAFSLTAAPTAGGPYTSIAGATSPYTNVFTGSPLFFRLRSK